MAILAGGRLVAAGRLSEILAFEVSGWELVVADVRGDMLDHVGREVLRTTRIADGRYGLDLAPDTVPEQILAAVTARGGRLVSLNPLP